MTLKKDPSRRVFEEAIKKMSTYGVNQILFSEPLTKKRNIIRDSLLKYYESTEEFEKCKFVKEFFQDVENKIVSERSIKK